MTIRTCLLRFLFWLIPALMLTLGILYTAVPSLLPPVLTPLFEHYGMTEATVIIERPGWNTWKIPLLSLKYPSHSFPLDMKFQNIEIQYSVQSLRKGLLDRVTIGPSQVSWIPPSLDPKDPEEEFPDNTSPEQSDNPANPGTLLPPFLFPIATFIVEELNVNLPQALSPLQQTTIQATITNQNDAVSGLMHIHSRNLPSYMAQFDIHQTGFFSAVISQARTPAAHSLTMTTHFLPAPADPLSLQGQVEIDLESLVTLAGRIFPLPPAFQDMTGTFTADWTGQLPVTGPVIKDLSASGNFSLTVSLPNYSPQLQNLHTLAGGKFTWDHYVLNLIIAQTTNGTVDWVADSSVMSFAGSLPGTHLVRPWKWQMLQPVSIQIPFSRPSRSLSISNGHIKATMKKASENLQLTLDHTTGHWDQQTGISGKARFHSMGHLPIIENTSVLLHKLTWDIEGELDYTTEQIDLRIQAGTHVAGEDIHLPSLHLPSAKVTWTRPMSLQADWPSLNWGIHSLDLDVHLPSISIQKMEPWTTKRVFLHMATLEKTGVSWHIEGNAQIHEVGTTVAGKTFPKVNATLGVIGNPQTLKAHYAIQGLPSLFTIKGGIQFSPSQGTGHGTFVLSPLILNPGQLKLSSLLQPWPWPMFDLTMGTLSSSVDLTWTSGKLNSAFPFELKRLQGFLRLNHLGGYFTHTLFDGLEGQLAFLGDQEALTLARSPLRLKRVQGAIPFTDVSAIVSGSMSLASGQTNLMVHQGNTHLLGGRVTASPLTLDSDLPSQQIMLTVEGLDLSQILALEQQDSVKGTGSLSGLLPLQINLPEVEIRKGWLKAHPPGGTLQMDLTQAEEHSWLKSQPNLDLVIQSLQNFQYHTLNIGLDYQKSGILQLDTRLEGKNPEYQEGRPIHFNLKIEENIPALLQSLSLVQGIEESIQQRMRGSNP